MKIYDCLIFGGGVIGCCIASDLARSGYGVCLVEKASDVAMGSSKANSGLVHGGFDAKPNTLKAKLNVEGNKMFPSLTKRLGVPLKKTGAIVVGNDEQAVKTLYERGAINGVKNLSVLNREQLLNLAPSLSESVTIGLYCKDAYIVSPYLLTICLAEEAIVNGAKVLLNFTTNKVTKDENNVFHVFSQDEEILAKRLINAAGAGVNDVAKLIGSEKYKVEFRRGEYYVLDSTEASTTPITVFPLPSKVGKGVLVTPTIDGNILVGPTSYESDDSTKTTLIGLNEIRQKSSLLLNNVNLKKSIRQFAGVRNIVGEDFVIENSKKISGVLNIAGICSPGLSSAPAISKYAIELLGLKYSPKDDKKIEPYRLFKNMTTAEKSALVSKNKSYGKLICKCENITEGDIIMALNRPLKICSVDGIKRRVRAGMGRCQGGFCSLPVAQIIAKIRKIPLEDVIKDDKNSKIFVGNIRGGNL